MNEALRPLPWQQELWLELTAQALGNRLAHALLLAGPRGVGKRRFAIALTAFLLCEARSGFACGTCRSCQQFVAGSHPNANLLSRDGHLALAGSVDGRAPQALVHWEPKKESKRGDVAIDAARSLIERLTLTAHYGRPKLALIEPADDLNASTANALLKTIEEPPPDTHLMLVAERPQGLPPTLRSRCQRIRFGVPPREAALAWLAAAGVRDPAAALDEAHGAPLLAVEWSQAGAVDQRREWSELWRAVAQRKRDPIAAASAVPREDLPALLDWLQGWLGAQLRAALGGQAGALAPAAKLSAMSVQALDARRLADGNANPQMLLEALLIEWARLTRAS